MVTAGELIEQAPTRLGMALGMPFGLAGYAAGAAYGLGSLGLTGLEKARGLTTVGTTPETPGGITVPEGASVYFIGTPGATPTAAQAPTSLLGGLGAGLGQLAGGVQAIGTTMIMLAVFGVILYFIIQIPRFIK